MKWILLITAIVTTMWVVHSDGCSKNHVHRRIKECTEPLDTNPLNKERLYMMMTGLHKTKQLCQSGKLQSVFSCLNDLYNRCAMTWDGASQNGLILAANTWREALEKICDNIHYLIDHEHCERQARGEFNTCAAKETERHTRRTNSVRTEMAASPTLSEAQKKEVMSDLACGYSMKIMECLRKPYEKYCPQQLTNLAVDIFQTFMPPACAKRAIVDAINQIPSNDDDEDSYESKDQDGGYRNEVVVKEKTGGRDRMDNVGYDVDKGGWSSGHVRDQAPPSDRRNTKGGPAHAAEVHDPNNCSRLSFDLLSVLALLIGCRLILPR